MTVNIDVTLRELPVPLFVYFACLCLAMIVVGRKLLWLYSGSAVFLIAYFVMQTGQIPGFNETTAVLISLGIGIVVSGALFFLKPVTLVISALILGVNVAGQFIRLLNLTGPQVELIEGGVVLLLGVVAAVGALRYRDDALVLLSVLVGVGALTQEILAMNPKLVSTAIVWLALGLFGVIVQYAGLQRDQRARQAKLAAASTPPVAVRAPEHP